MASRTREKFTHRQERNGMFESICMCCYRRVGSAGTEEGLALSEFIHQCLESDLIAANGLSLVDDDSAGYPN